MPPLTVVDEHTFPTRGSFESLLAGRTPAQWELLAGSHMRASAWSPDCVTDKGGTPIPKWWKRDPAIHLNPVNLFRVRDYYFAPQFGALISLEGAVLLHSAAQSRVMSPDYSGLPYAEKRDGYVLFTPPADLPTIDKAVVSMPFGALHNYGHFLCDCLATVSQIKDDARRAGYPFAFPNLKPWQRRHLELAGVDVLELDQPLYRVNDAIFANSMARFIHYPNVSYRSLRDQQLKAAESRIDGRSRVYVSRAEVSKISTQKRQFLNESELQIRLQDELGFSALTPESLSVDDQIAAFNRANVVVGCWGAAMANCIFCSPGTTIVEILPTVVGMRGYKWIRNICAINGLRWRPFFSLGRPPEVPLVVGGRVAANLGFTFDVNVDDLVVFVRAQLGYPVGDRPAK